MLAYIIRRVLLGIPTLLGVLLLFFLLYFVISSPEHIAQRVKGEKADDAVIAQWIAEKGYDKPRFFNPSAPGLAKISDTILFQFSRRLITFDFGRADLDDIPIRDKLADGVGPSLTLTLPMFLVTTLVAIATALLFAVFRMTYVDRVGVILCVVGMSIVYFVYIMGGQYYLGKVWRWFPISGWSPRYPMHFLTLPILVGVVAGVGESVRFYRTVMINEVNHDYIRTARAKGVGDAGVMFKHLLRNAMIPILTRLIMAIPYLLVGSLLLESFFGIPGLGRLTVQSLQNNDFSVASTMVYLSALFYIAFNILTDISYTLVDPRIRLR